MKESLIILTSEDKLEIKESLKKMCLEQIKADISSIYLVDTDYLNEVYTKLVEELKDDIKKELREEYGEAIKLAIMKSIGLKG